MMKLTIGRLAAVMCILLAVSLMAAEVHAATKTYRFEVLLERYEFDLIADRDGLPPPPGYIPPEARWGTLGIGGTDVGAFSYDAVTKDLLSCSMRIGGDCMAPFGTGGPDGFRASDFISYDFDLSPMRLMYGDDFFGQNADYTWFGETAQFRTVSISQIPLPPSAVFLCGLFAVVTIRRRGKKRPASRGI